MALQHQALKRQFLVTGLQGPQLPLDLTPEVHTITQIAPLTCPLAVGGLTVQNQATVTMNLDEAKDIRMYGTSPFSPHIWWYNVDDDVVNDVNNIDDAGTLVHHIANINLLDKANHYQCHVFIYAFLKHVRSLNGQKNA